MRLVIDIEWRGRVAFVVAKAGDKTVLAETLDVPPVGQAWQPGTSTDLLAALQEPLLAAFAGFSDHVAAEVR
jgi:hypothetical protein